MADSFSPVKETIRQYELQGSGSSSTYQENIDQQRLRAQELRKMREAQQTMQLTQHKLSGFSHLYDIPIDKLPVRARDTFMVVSREHEPRYYRVNNAGAMIEIFYHVNEHGEVQEAKPQSEPSTAVGNKGKERMTEDADAMLMDEGMISGALEDAGKAHSYSLDASMRAIYSNDQGMKLYEGHFK